MKPQLEARAAASQVPIKRINIMKWDSAVAQQYQIQRIPALWLYTDGKLVSKDTRQVMDKLS